jgi:hypothetical protein
MDREQLTQSSEPKIEIAVLGLGYVGLPAAWGPTELEGQVAGIVPGPGEGIQQAIPSFASNCEGVCAH